MMQYDAGATRQPVSQSGRGGAAASFPFLRPLTRIAHLLWHCCYNCIHQFPTAAVTDTL